MGKLASYVLGVTSVLVLSYYVLSRDYSSLIGWLGPVFGSNMIFPLSFAYILLGNPIKWPLLFLVWVLIGVIVGIVARKGSRAIGSAVAIYFTIWMFLIVSAVVLISGIVTGPFSTSAATLPPLPSGTSVDAILREPLLQELLAIILQISGISLLSGTSASGSAASSSPSFSSFIQSNFLAFLPYLIINLAIFLIVAYFVGRIFHSTFYKKPESGAPAEESGRNDNKKENTRSSNTKMKSALFVVSIVLLSSFFSMATPFAESPIIHNASNTGTISGTSFLQSSNHDSYIAGMESLNSTLDSTNLIFQSAAYTSNISYNLSSFDSVYYGGGAIGAYGNLYNIYTFLKRENTSSANFLGKNSTSGSLFTILAISNNISNVFSYLSEDSIITIPTVSTVSSNQLYNLIPQTVIVNAFLGNLSQTKNAADKQASKIAYSLGSSSLTEIIGLPLNMTIKNNQNAIVSLYVFSSVSKTFSAENNALNLTSSQFSNSGPMTLFASGITDGYLVPGHNIGSVDSSIFIVGDLNLKYFGNATSSFTSSFSSTGFLNDTKSIVFMGGIFAKGKIAHSSPSTHTFDASQIFNYQGDVSFSDSKTIYALSLTYPDPNGSAIGGLSKYKTIFYVTIANLSVPLGTSNSSTQVVQGYGSSVGLQSVSFQTNVTFPADLSVTQSYKILSHNVVQVQVSVLNNDTEAVDNLMVNANQFQSEYPGGYTIANGSATISQGTLQPGQSISLKYTLNLEGVGKYIVSSPQLNYTLNGSAFSVTNGQQVISATYPFITTSINNIALTVFTSLGHFISAPFLAQQLFYGFYFFDLIPVLFVVLAIFFEYRSYAKWRKAKK